MDVSFDFMSSDFAGSPAVKFCGQPRCENDLTHAFTTSVPMSARLFLYHGAEHVKRPFANGG
jgi:hypothetical protein